jgi:hypothetical protein
MNYIIAILVAIHGFVHLVGFVVAWRLAELKEMPYSTRVFGGKLDVGDTGVRFVGLLWLIAALGYFAAAGAILFLTLWWLTALFVVTLFSLLLCIAGWPHSKIGLFIDIGILAVFATGWILGWSPILSIG